MTDPTNKNNINFYNYIYLYLFANVLHFIILKTHKEKGQKDKHWSTKHYTKPTENLSHMVIKKHRVFNIIK
jgi:hypothetical protein